METTMTRLSVILCMCLLAAASVAAQDVGMLCLADTNHVVLDEGATVMLIKGKQRTVLTPDERPQFSWVPSCRISRLPVGEINVRIEKDLFEPQDITVTIAAKRLTLKAVTLKPTKDNVAQGRVTDDKGKGIAGARILDGDDLLGLTDKAGKFQLVGAFRQSVTCELSIEAEGYETERVSLEARKKAEPVTLKKTTRIFGNVKGLKDVTAPAQASWGEADEYGQRPYADGELMKDGTYSITIRYGYTETEFSGGNIDVVVTYAGLECKALARAVKPGAWVELDLACSTKGTGSLSGSVIGVDGKPLAGVTVEFTATGYGRETSAVTDENGAYQIAVVPAGDYWSRVRTDGNRSFRYLHKRTASVIEGADTAFDFDYTGLMVARCRFVKDYHLYTGILVDDAGGTGFAPYTDECYEGWFELYGAKAATYEFRLQGDGDAVQSVAIPQSDTVVIIDRVLEAASVSGKLVFPDGAPPGKRDAWCVELYERYFVCKTAKVDADGSFRFSDVTPGEFHIAASVPGHYSAWLPLEIDGAVTHDLEVFAAASVRVTAKFNGIPCESLNVTVIFRTKERSYRPLPWPEASFKDGQPLLVCDRLPPGKTMVRINSQIFATWKKGVEPQPLMKIPDQVVELKAGEITDVTIELALAAEIFIEGLPGGTSLEEVWLEDVDGNKLEGMGGPSMGSNDHDTYASFDSIKPGTYYLVIEKSGYKKYREKFDLAAGKVRTVKPKLERAE
jgi:hypothetical protein